MKKYIIVSLILCAFLAPNMAKAYSTAELQGQLTQLLRQVQSLMLQLVSKLTIQLNSQTNINPSSNSIVCEHAAPPRGYHWETGYPNTCADDYLAQDVSTVTISNITPSSGAVGTQITITGSGFLYSDPGIFVSGTNMANVVKFNSMIVANVYSNSSNSLTFIIPASSPSCSSSPCTNNYLQVSPGTYQVTVSNTRGTSNALNFTVQ